MDMNFKKHIDTGLYIVVWVNEIKTIQNSLKMAILNLYIGIGICIN